LKNWHDLKKEKKNKNNCRSQYADTVTGHEKPFPVQPHSLLCVCNRYPISRVCLSCATRGRVQYRNRKRTSYRALCDWAVCSVCVAWNRFRLDLGPLSDSVAHARKSRNGTDSRLGGGQNNQTLETDLKSLLSTSFCFLSRCNKKKERRETLGISTSPTSKTNRVVTKFPLRKPPAVACCCFDLPGLIRLQSREAERKV
jgi:hypothetical protein